jgi:hypothetical protein
MFIAWRFFLTPKLRRSAIAFCIPREIRCRVSLLRSEVLGRALAAINISLLWSENEINCCTLELGPQN